MTQVAEMTMPELRNAAKDQGINTFQMGKAALRKALSPKKARKPWRPATVLDVQNKDPDLHYRWCHNEASNLERKELEGWQFVNAVTGGEADHEPLNISDGSPLGSAKTYRDLVLMTMDDETAEARAEYYRGRTRKQTVSVVDDLRENIRGKAEQTGSPLAPVHGKIIIE